MSAPERIQLRRTKGWRKPDGAVVVSRPSKWGNPFTVTEFAGGWSVDGFGDHYDVYETKSAAAARAVFLFATLTNINPFHQQIREALAGRDLACWCPFGQPCHADVLLKVANR